jgi:hypothetical protein
LVNFKKFWVLIPLNLHLIFLCTFWNSESIYCKKMLWIPTNFLREHILNHESVHYHKRTNNFSFVDQWLLNDKCGCVVDYY